MGRNTNRLSLRIPRSRTHEMRLQNAANEVGKIVRASAQYNRLRAQPRRSNLRNDCVHNRPHAHRVAAQPHETHDALSQAEPLRLRIYARHDAD